MSALVYRICKQFEVENGHMLTKHPERCRFPHGHTRRVEVVLEAATLNAADMVVDFKALKLAAADFIDQFDHALCINVADPLYPAVIERFGGPGGRIIAYEGVDPTTEVMARQIFEHLTRLLETGGRLTNPESGATYEIPAGLRVRRLRLWETSSSWAEVEATD
jgi:6-pyruvoyltetrahydropterin/6-carboxytetrahydropterin synthase